MILALNLASNTAGCCMPRLGMLTSVQCYCRYLLRGRAGSTEPTHEAEEEREDIIDIIEKTVPNQTGVELVQFTKDEKKYKFMGC